jgi:hypothetical protein
MNKRQKRLTIIGILVLLIIAAGIAGIRYFPFNKIWKVASVPETDFIKQPDRTALPNTIYCDFEVDPKTGNKNGLYQGIAHSGQFSAKAFGKNSYSIAIERSPGEISASSLNAAGVSTWVYIFPTGKEINGAFVFSANNEVGVNICWKSVPVSGPGIPQGKWFKISGLFDLSGIKWKPNYKIQVYFWNNSSTDILVDDYYIVLGRSKERRGDSTLVDMTKNQPFQPRYNYPPFPFVSLEKEEINNLNSVYLINSGEEKTGDISPNDQIFAGNFTGSNDGKDDMLVVKSSGTCELYHFCSDQSRFIRYRTSVPSDLLTFFAKGNILRGNFTGTGQSELLIIKEKKLLVGSFEKIKNHCKTSGDAQTAFKVIWMAGEKEFPYLNAGPGEKYFSADFDGNKQSELLLVHNNGSWDLFRYSSPDAVPLKKIASGKENSIREWNTKDLECTVNAGRFLNTCPNDLILTTSKNKGTGKTGFSLLKYDAGTGQFIPVFREKYHFPGRIVGPDTLKTGDQYFTGVFDNTGRNRVFRYNCDWRFDLKEIRFNDSTYQVLSNIDFTGYEKDHNPKYYEVIKIAPGHFLDSGTVTFLVIARNCRQKENDSDNCKEFSNLPYLPNTLQFYGYPKEGPPQDSR